MYVIGSYCYIQLPLFNEMIGDYLIQANIRNKYNKEEEILNFYGILFALLTLLLSRSHSLATIFFSKLEKFKVKSTTLEAEGELSVEQLKWKFS